jgi:outer membrane murein-binding lipoprotein Lpp
MQKKTIIYGVIIVVLLIAVGILIGREYRKREEIDIAVKGLSAEIDKLDDTIDILEDDLDVAEDKAEVAVEAAVQADAERDSFKSALATSGKRVTYWRKRAANKVEPITLEESKEYIGELEGENSTLKKTLVKTEEAAFHWKAASESKDEIILFKDDIIATQDDQIDIWEKKFNIVYKKSKKEHRQKIWSNILSGSLGLTVGIAVGKGTS